jgi:hypothetical protein
MRRVIHLDFDEVRPRDTDVLTRLGMPKNATIAPALRALLDEAAVLLASTAEPRGVFQPISKDEYAEVFRGEGKNAEQSPLDLIYPRADALALFVATIGEKSGQEIDLLFRKGDPALAMVADAFASEATNDVAEALCSRFLEDLRREHAVAKGAHVLPYSPGYCGWHLTGQRAIFRVVNPADIGVVLETSCLMLPIKSVSGVLIAGDATVHRFRPEWTFCDECKTHDCGPRMASVRS